MNTIINNPGNTGDGESTGVGLILGIILAIVIIALFFVYALPAIRGTSTPQNGTVDVNIKLPPGDNTPPAPPVTP